MVRDRLVEADPGQIVAGKAAPRVHAVSDGRNSPGKERGVARLGEPQRDVGVPPREPGAFRDRHQLHHHARRELPQQRERGSEQVRGDERGGRDPYYACGLRVGILLEHPREHRFRLFRLLGEALAEVGRDQARSIADEQRGPYGVLEAKKAARELGACDLGIADSLPPRTAYSAATRATGS
jgi:hypothetical protein